MQVVGDIAEGFELPDGKCFADILFREVHESLIILLFTECLDRLLGKACSFRGLFLLRIGKQRLNRNNAACIIGFRIPYNDPGFDFAQMNTDETAGAVALQ